LGRSGRIKERIGEIKSQNLASLHPACRQAGIRGAPPASPRGSAIGGQAKPTSEEQLRSKDKGEIRGG